MLASMVLTSLRRHMAASMGLPLGDLQSQLAALTLQMPPYQTESSPNSARERGRSSIPSDFISVQACNPMFEAEKLFADIAHHQNVLAQNPNLFTYPCNNHSCSAAVSSCRARHEGALPVLFAGSGNVLLKPPPTTCPLPSFLPGNASMDSTESTSSAGSSPNTGSEFILGKQDYYARDDRNPLKTMPSISLGEPLETKSPLHGKKVLDAPRRSATHFSSEVEIFARKVFVGGLPIDVTEEEIWQTFSVFGNVIVDWPRRTEGTGARDEESGRARSMTGYVFLVFEQESSVQYLVNECHKEDDRYYLFVSSPTMRDKPVQVRPWRLADMDFIKNPNATMDPRTTVFIGGVPRPTKASELAECLQRLYGPVCYVGIDIDPELKYPKGAARVTFVTTQAFVAAINGRFVHLLHGESQKRVEIKPYMMDEQICDHCEGKMCSSRYAPYFCGDVECLQYYCEICWDRIHYLVGTRRMEHRPLVRMGEQTKVLPRPPHHSSRTSRCFNGSNQSRHYGASSHI